VLLEAHAGELVEADFGNLTIECSEHWTMLGYPIVGGKELDGAESCCKQIAYYLMALGYEEVLGLAELFLLQLAHKFYLIFTYHYLNSFNSATKVQKIRHGLHGLHGFFLILQHKWTKSSLKIY
jgi:hypothetical protein